MLTLESLRQLYARSGDSIADKIGAVVFASPISTWTYSRRRLVRIGPVGRKITVVTATKRPRAGAVGPNSRRDDTGRRRREGRHRAARGARHRCVRRGWGVINHDLFLSNAEVRRVIRRSIDTSAA
jgi:hypothetical protein